MCEFYKKNHTPLDVKYYYINNATVSCWFIYNKLGFGKLQFIPKYVSPI